MEIRRERAADVEAIAAVTAVAFATAGHGGGDEAAIVAALRAADALVLSLVAVEDGALIGHAALSPVAVERAAGPWYGLGPVSVRPDRQRRGVGTALIRAALDAVREAGAAGCVVLGDPAYYGRFGFAHDPRLRYADAPPPFFQRLIWRGPPPAGVVRYHAAFGG